VTDDWLRVLTIVTAIGAGVVGGVFYAFSTFVMPGLGRLSAAEGIASMQAINVEAERPGLLSALLGTALASLALVVVGVLRLGEPEAAYLLIGSGLYLVQMVVTIAYHVPRNNALGRVDPKAADAADTWARYLREWTVWNHVRTVTCIAGAVVLTLALLA
jgi:uncharacterized membrane protein